MKKWYPSLALGALLFVLCSMSIQGTSSLAKGADKLTNLSSVLYPNNEANSTENANSFSQMAMDTQVINMPLSAALNATLVSCEQTTVFQNRFEHQYPDTVAHRDTLTICSPNNSKRIGITFTEFEVAPGDTLFVYDADNIRADRQVAAFSGVGVSATGGWINSECDPSGCLTFEFVTNGDNIKGLGWESWVTCLDELEEIALVCPAIASTSLECDEAIAIVPITAPEAFIICAEAVDSFCLTIINSNGEVCLDSCVLANQVIADTFGVGQFKAVWRAKNFPDFTAEKFFTIAAPTLVCNDEVAIPFGSACALSLTPDMLLEGLCDTIADTLYYRIDIELGSGKLTKTITGGGGPGIAYPTIHKDTLERYGVANFCQGQLTAKVTRVYYEYMLDDMTICANGMVETSCSTIVNFEDQSPPFLFSSNGIDTFVICDNENIEDMLTPPEVAANCDSAIVSLESVDALNDINVCSTGSVVLRWKAVDLCGNTAFLTETIFITRPTIFYEPTRTTLNCDEALTFEDAERPGLITGQIKNGVLIPRDTVELSTEEYICGYILVRNDEQFPSTDCGERWVREWKILDWCNPSIGPVSIGTQVVIITDTVAPTFVNCPDPNAIGGVNQPILIDLGNFECEINLTGQDLEAPRAIDNCDPNPSVTMFCVERFHLGEWKKIGTNLSNAGALSCDTFRIGWVANDACFEQVKADTCFKHVLIRDVTPPSVVCVDQLNLSVGSDVARIIGVEEIDAGSWDACGIAKREISINGVDYGQETFLNCEAIDSDLSIYLRVTDAKGNENICLTRINIKDDIYPSCGTLPDVDLFCDEFNTGDFGSSTDTNGNGIFDDDEYLPLDGATLARFNSEYGNPMDICEDNIRCHPVTIEQQFQLLEWPCGQTRIQRRYRATDWQGNQSAWQTQLIALQYRPNWEIDLPQDWSGECGEPFPAASLDIRFGACDQIGWEHEDKVFIIEDEACYKVERTFHIINWCLYSAGDRPFPLNRREDEHGFASGETINHNQYLTNGYLTYIQILKVHSFDGPVITINDVDTCLVGDGVATTNPDGSQNCDEMRTFSAEAETCVDFETLDFWWSIYADNVKVDSGQGSKFTFPVNPRVVYRVSFSASDPCGNGATQSRIFEFNDCRNPTPLCRAGLNVEMGQEGKITIWGSDIDLGSFDNCTTTDQLNLRLWHASLGDLPSTTEMAKALPANLDFDCESAGIQTVRLYVIDKDGNYAFCTSMIDVQDNMNVCSPSVDPMSVVSGRIQTTTSEMINNVTVTATSSDGNSIATVTQDGLFQFSLPKNNIHTLKPELDTNPLNGVTTFDLVLISKHILGLQLFNSPYQYVAADVNQSGTISAYDMVQLRQLILNINSKFPNNTSWKFVDNTYVFPTENPIAENYRETVELSNMTDEMQVGFMAVKIGDVNQSASFTNNQEADSRSVTKIEVAEQSLEEGQIYTVDFVLPAKTSLEGYQFTIDYKDLTLVEMVEATAKTHNFGFNLTERGLLTTSWNTNDAAETTGDTKLFSLVFKSGTAGRLSEKLAITSSITAAEAYDVAGNISNVTLDFKDSESEGIQLYQNRPNPFRDNTSIGFYLPSSGEAVLSILDVQGKVLKEIRGTYEKGYQEIQLNAADLSGKGVLYYQLTTDKKQVVKRMIVIE